MYAYMVLLCVYYIFIFHMGRHGMILASDLHKPGVLNINLNSKLQCASSFWIQGNITLEKTYVNIGATNIEINRNMG